jgi:glyoxylase-like metal-dependent hydrolase (beta-lactamase superfamily II)
MFVKKFLSKIVASNLYVYYDQNTKDAVVIDPSGSLREPLKFIADQGLNVKAVLLTHGHFDHMSAAPELRERLNIPIMAHKDETELLISGDKNYSRMFFETAIEITPDAFFADGDELEFGSVKLKVLHAPGHTLGSVCFYDESEGIVFTGDTLFYEGIGRTDLDLAAPYLIIPSIKNKLLTLPPETVAYPGHGASSTIGHEKNSNPWIA